MVWYFHAERDREKSLCSQEPGVSFVAWRSDPLATKWDTVAIPVEVSGSQGGFAPLKIKPLSSVKRGENKWEGTFSSKRHCKCCSAGAWDLPPAAPVPPTLCLGFVKLQFHTVWRKAQKSIFHLPGETITTKVSRGNVKALLCMCHLLYINTTVRWKEAPSSSGLSSWDGPVVAINVACSVTC